MPGMPVLHPLALAEVSASAWKNGGGRTRELICEPPGATLDNFVWRISVAEVDASGPFSVFPGIERIITLLDGPGMLLHGDEHEHALTSRLRPHTFPGDVRIHATLAGGPSRDFNLMWRRNACHASMQVVRQDLSIDVLAQRCQHLLFAVDGDWQLSGDAHDMTLPREHLLRIPSFDGTLRLRSLHETSALLHLMIQPTPNS